MHFLVKSTILSVALQIEKGDVEITSNDITERVANRYGDIVLRCRRDICRAMKHNLLRITG